MLVAEDASFQVADHDFTRCSFTPSVTMNIDVPETVDGSWYDGSVRVGLKCSVFEPSSPARHVLELETMMASYAKPVVLMYTDGGPDHRYV